jgi:hypothetical protein
MDALHKHDVNELEALGKNYWQRGGKTDQLQVVSAFFSLVDNPRAAPAEYITSLRRACSVLAAAQLPLLLVTSDEGGKKNPMQVDCTPSIALTHLPCFAAAAAATLVYHQHNRSDLCTIERWQFQEFPYAQEAQQMASMCDQFVNSNLALSLCNEAIFRVSSGDDKLCKHAANPRHLELLQIWLSKPAFVIRAIDRLRRQRRQPPAYWLWMDAGIGKTPKLRLPRLARLLNAPRPPRKTLYTHWKSGRWFGHSVQAAGLLLGDAHTWRWFHREWEIALQHMLGLTHPFCYDEEVMIWLCPVLNSALKIAPLRQPPSPRPPTSHQRETRTTSTQDSHNTHSHEGNRPNTNKTTDATPMRR